MFRAFALSLTVMTMPAFAETVEIDTYIGAAEVTVQPDRIAVFDIAALDTLDALGIEVDGVVSPLSVDYVSDTAEGADPVGTLFEPDYEAIAAGGYDLLIAGGRSSRVVPELSEVASTIDMTIWEDTVGQGLARLNAYGEIFGKQDEAAALQVTFEDALDAAKAAVADEGSALIVMTNGPTVSAYGANGRFGWLHTALEIPEAVEAVEQATHGEAISFEFIRDANPDVLIVIDRAAAIGQEGDAAAMTLDNVLVHETAAWSNDKVIYLNSANVYIANGGMQSMTQIVSQFATKFAD
ncbi:iron complex transport system substrate-binding protein [Octadecabacter temperatus]|uniref:Putative ABC transporter solute-binding protein YclQ n=1 Tax=Octadecabacter temperatus TaxID=1458307 RepID=A0A0K0Y5T9_9RHOB|nr:ABC transporter substrate-binding protein [Octadecabacter temperatus]AKS46358.1 putative ABC transporter solute-binding protein YclQ precursor [Octadecabacter temperatus]SIO12507.1 iron complex transport system substrate-binding protein [Octadecabacter temperatus]